MLRNKLLTTTFLMIVGSVSFSPGEAGGISVDQLRGIAMSGAGGAGNRASVPQTHIEFGNPGRDRNMDFLCTYGYRVRYTTGREESFHWIDWTHYAVPIRGKGTAVTEIIVTDSPGTGSSGFNVGIYENTNGRPGTLIAGGKGRAEGSCLLTTVAIPKTFLAAGKKYWVEEDAKQYGTNAVYWGYNPNAKHNAYYQYYSFSSTSGTSSRYLSDWLPVSGPAPFVKVR